MRIQLDYWEQVKIVPYILHVIWENIGFFCHFWCKNILAYWAKTGAIWQNIDSLPPQKPCENLIPPKCDSPPYFAINIELFLPFLPDILITQWIIVQKG